LDLMHLGSPGEVELRPLSRYQALVEEVGR
jgi:hypothetical protein